MKNIKIVNVVKDLYSNVKKILVNIQDLAIVTPMIIALLKLMSKRKMKKNKSNSWKKKFKKKFKNKQQVDLIDIIDIFFYKYVIYFTSF